MHSTGVVTEYTARRILKSLELPLSEDAWRYALAHASVAGTPSRGKVVSDPCVRYKELVLELERMHDGAIKQQRVDAVLASVSVKGGNHLSESLRTLPAETLQDAEALEKHVLSVLREPPISLPQYLFEAAIGLGKMPDGQLNIERLLNVLAKSAVRDPFQHVRTKLLDKYGTVMTAFRTVAKLHGGRAIVV